MPRGKQNTSAIDTPAKRARLEPSEARGAYFEKVWRGLAVGYFRPRSGPGTWWVKMATGGRTVKRSFAVADDPGGATAASARALPLLDYEGAVKKAQALAASATAPASSRRAAPAPEETATYRYQTATPRSYTVGDLLADHARALAAEGKVSSARAVERAAEGPLFAALVDRRVVDLRGADLIAWRDGVAASAPLVRRSGAGRLLAMPKTADADDRRKRRVRANRLVTDLKAARNRLAKRVDWLPQETAAEFAKLEKFRDVGRGKVRPLDGDEVSRLLAACGTSHFRDLVLGALLTGARYGELVRLRVGDFRATDGKVHFARTKDEQERGRDVALSTEGVEHFARLTKGRAPDAPLFAKSDGTAWGTSAQFRPMNEAVAQAGLSPYPHRPTFHSLRDTFATTLLRSGVRLEIVSKILGHSSVALTEKHYAAFADSDLDTAARSLPRFAQAPAKVASIAGRRKAVAK